MEHSGQLKLFSFSRLRVKLLKHYFVFSSKNIFSDMTLLFLLAFSKLSMPHFCIGGKKKKKALQKASSFHLEFIGPILSAMVPFWPATINPKQILEAWDSTQNFPLCMSLCLAWQSDKTVQSFLELWFLCMFVGPVSFRNFPTHDFQTPENLFLS